MLAVGGADTRGGKGTLQITARQGGLKSRGVTWLTFALIRSTIPAWTAGLAASLARPEGNVTGLSAIVGYETVGKRLQLLKAAAPQLSRPSA